MDDDARILRLSAAICCAPMLGAAVCAAAVALVLACSGPDYCSAGLIGLSLAWGVALGLALGLPVMLLVGLPTHAWLVRTRRTSLRTYAIAGVLPGVLAAVGLMLFLPPQPDLRGQLFYIAVGAVTGAVSAALFWLIRRPDIAPANPVTPPA